MSMSTGDIRRPSANTPQAKANAGAGPKAKPKADPPTSSDATDSPDATDPPEEPASTARDATTARPGALSAAKAATRTSDRADAKPTAGKATAGKATAGKATAAKPMAGKPMVGKTAKKAPAGRPPAKGGGKGRRTLAPVKVSQGRNWGPIMMFGGAGLVAVLIIGFGAFSAYRATHKPKWQDEAAGIEGINNYLASNPDWFKYGADGNHKKGPLEYPTSPPVGGVHNPIWQNCMGDVYPAQVPKEQATHSMEHGAVWVAYRPDLPKDQIDALAGKVDGKAFMLMSPYPGLDRPISLQAWGYQLKVDSASDGRIDDFIAALRKNATQEPEAGCSGGITDTGTTPLDLTPLNPGGGAGAGAGG